MTCACALTGIAPKQIAAHNAVLNLELFFQSLERETEDRVGCTKTAARGVWRANKVKILYCRLNVVRSFRKEGDRAHGDGPGRTAN